MPIDYNIPGLVGNVPWFMFDIDNIQLITNILIPGDISDTKNVILTETPIPGRNNAPVQYGGGGNRHVSFTIPLINRNNSIGNILLLKQFDLLRNQFVGLTSIFSDQFRANPKVLYYWGIGSIPLLYYVAKCDATHKQHWTNNLGNPQYSELNVELILDEDNTLYTGEEIFRRASAITGTFLNTYDLIDNILSGGKPV